MSSPVSDAAGNMTQSRMAHMWQGPSPDLALPGGLRALGGLLLVRPHKPASLAANSLPKYCLARVCFLL